MCVWCVINTIQKLYNMVCCARGCTSFMDFPLRAAYGGLTVLVDRCACNLLSSLNGLVFLFVCLTWINQSETAPLAAVNQPPALPPLPHMAQPLPCRNVTANVYTYIIYHILTDCGRYTYTHIETWTQLLASDHQPHHKPQITWIPLY